jgi:hypothetical protein
MAGQGSGQRGGQSGGGGSSGSSYSSSEQSSSQASSSDSSVSQSSGSYGGDSSSDFAHYSQYAASGSYESVDGGGGFGSLFSRFFSGSGDRPSRAGTIAGIIATLIIAGIVIVILVLRGFGG